MPEPTQRHFAHGPESVHAAREFATATLTAWGQADLIDDVRLCVSELATNAVVHGGEPSSGFLVRIAVVDHDFLRLEVHNRGGGTPTPRRADDTDTDGRSLLLVAALTESWGLEPASSCGCVVVWSRFKAPS